MRLRLPSPRAIPSWVKRDLQQRYLSASLRLRMSTRDASRRLPEEHSSKRRRVEFPRSRYMRPFSSMASDSNKTRATLELTEIETNLRQLLLNVAAYIEQTSGAGVRASAVKVPQQLKEEKIILRFTGGWVRDKLLGVGSHDIDVAINNMTGEHFGLKMIEYLEIPGNAAKHGLEPKAEGKVKSGGEKKSRKIAPGLHKIEANPEKSKNLETATTRIMGVDLDLVNLRRETYTEVSRNPEIEFGTPEEDAMRRDATVNAMFFNLNTLQIEDFTNRGFEDMDAKVIRTPLEPHQTFKDDPLRILRLIRFASRLNYTIDPETEKAMSSQEIGEVLKIKISRERVGIELEKMLKGPDPLRALSLIDKLGLYGTIFTDPTRALPSRPDMEYFPSAYRFVDFLLQGPAKDVPLVIPETLLPNPEEQYLAWVSAALMPWADAPSVPNQKPTQRPYYTAYLVAREGFKAPNKICDIVTASLQNGDEIRQLIDRCYTQFKRRDAPKAGDDASARDTLGMAIRRWGASWRAQVLFSMVYETVLGSISRNYIIQAYSTFLSQVVTHGLLDVHTFKPLISGTQLAKELYTKPGPWMKDALDVVMAWQLRNPDVTDPAKAIEAVKKSRNNQTQCELSSSLASNFLRLIVRPLFSQARNPILTPAGQRAPEWDTKIRHHGEYATAEPWKDPQNASAIDLLRWSITVQDTKSVEANWALLVPPMLKMIDDIDLHWKATGSSLLTLLLERAPPTLLSRTGLSNVFSDSLFPLFTYLPTLTPEIESIALFDEVFPATLALAVVAHPTSTSSSPSSTSLSTQREKFIDRVIRDGILSPLFHAPPATYPKLGTSLLSHLPALLEMTGIDSVKHLQSLTSSISNILSDPLCLAYPPLPLSALKGLQSLISNSWPRVKVHRGMIMKGVCLCWIRCEEDYKNEQGMDELRQELSEIVSMMNAVFEGDEEVRNAWIQEKQGLIDADEQLTGLLRS